MSAPARGLGVAAAVGAVVLATARHPAAAECRAGRLAGSRLPPGGPRGRFVVRALGPGSQPPLLGAAGLQLVPDRPDRPLHRRGQQGLVRARGLPRRARVAASARRRPRALADPLGELRRQEATLAAATAADLLGEGPFSVRLRTAARRVGDAVGVEGARIVEGELAAPEGIGRDRAVGRRADGSARCCCRTASRRPSSSACGCASPRALGTLLESALERDRLAAEVVETEALRRSDALKTALLRATSHDLRSPITAIIAAGETLRSATLPQADREELADVVVGEGTRLDELISKLLDLSRLQAGTAEPHADWCEIGELLHAAVEDVEARDPGGGSFTFAIQRDLPLVRADPAQLERVFANLLENARRFSAGQPVSVRARVVGEPARRARRRPGPGDPPGRAAARLRSVLARDRPSPRGADAHRLGARACDRQGLRRGQRRAHRAGVGARARAPRSSSSSLLSGPVEAAAA